MTATRVLIVDDQAMIRAGFRSLLEDEPDIDVVGEAVDGQDALRKVVEHDPDVVLMDIRMPNLDGLAATRQLAQAGHRCRVVVITTFDIDEYVFEALRAGASGFLLKDATAEELIAAIHTVAGGEALIDPSVTRRVIDAFVAAPAPSAVQAHQLSRLTDRELQVLRLIARGLSNAEIAGRLVVSEATAKTHVSSVLNKLGLRDRIQGVVWAYETGLIRAGDRDA